MAKKSKKKSAKPLKKMSRSAVRKTKGGTVRLYAGDGPTALKVTTTL